MERLLLAQMWTANYPADEAAREAAVLEDMMDALEPSAEELSNQRYMDIWTEADEEYQDGYQEYLDGLKEKL